MVCSSLRSFLRFAKNEFFLLCNRYNSLGGVFREKSGKVKTTDAFFLDDCTCVSTYMSPEPPSNIHSPPRTHSIMTSISNLPLLQFRIIVRNRILKMMDPFEFIAISLCSERVQSICKTVYIPKQVPDDWYVSGHNSILGWWRQV
uniref:F-box domain-containing protein n=1 Tax=Caenorhabditis tropicalis TaxID=1561998 RepID=A0A1I7U9L3_9PELO